MSEVKRLQQELAITKSKLQSASEMISKMPSEGTLCVVLLSTCMCPVAFSQSEGYAAVNEHFYDVCIHVSVFSVTG